METISSINDAINSLVWGVPMLIMIVGSGLFLTIGVKFLQFIRLPYIFRETIGKAFQKQETEEGSVSPLQALTTALAATVGTGNIAGVAGAITMGGPGAIFWMWLSALFGMATKYAEVTLAIKFRERNENGDWVGGPMYYIKNGLGAKFRPLAVIFAVFACLAAFGIGNMTQGNTIADSVYSAVASFQDEEDFTVEEVYEGDLLIRVDTYDKNQFLVESETFDAEGNSSTETFKPPLEGTVRIIVGLVVTVLCAMVLLGGMKRIGAVTERLVPMMAGIYILACCFVILSNIGALGTVLASIFKGAFQPDAVLGGAVGITIAEAAKRGIGRGVFSNEAGLGSAPIAHAAAQTDSPVKQGLYGVFEVFADTIVICTLTALTILCSGIHIDYGNSSAGGVDLTIAAFSESFPGQMASVLVAIGLSLFAISTILSWGLYGTRCCEFLWGAKAAKIYQIVFVMFITVGCTMNLELAWSIADTLNGLMAIPNLIAVLLLSGTVFALTKEHFSHGEFKGTSQK
ncbi:MAG: sodium:alanine symporter family protein [Eubacteriales bacterium]